MVRALDHLVLPCRDLAAAAAAFEGLGFLVGRRNRHPWGTENHIVQFDGIFLELVAFAADAALPQPSDDTFPFAGFLAGLGPSRAPSGMVVLRAADAAGDAAAFAREGIGHGRMLHFARDAAGLDGRPRRVSFSLAFADNPLTPDLGFFTCQQQAPENFWNPALQRHPNGTTGVAAVILAAADPAAQAAFLSTFADQPAVQPLPDGLTMDLGNSRLDIIAGDGPARLAALRFARPPSGTAPEQINLDGLPRLILG